jgi:5-methylcytosine-specific restriction endonuclease McrA
MLKTQRLIVDHIRSLKERPDLALSPQNLQLLHHSCNSRKAAWTEKANDTRIRVGTDGFPV